MKSDYAQPGSRKTANSADATAVPRFDVVWPLSPKAVKLAAASPRVPDLNGKTVCELWDVLFRGDQIYPQVRDHIRARFPGVNFVGHTEFGNFHGLHEHKVHAALADKIREHKADAAIVGIGA
jgi:hypothetical protein